MTSGDPLRARRRIPCVYSRSLVEKGSLDSPPIRRVARDDKERILLRARQD